MDRRYLVAGLFFVVAVTAAVVLAYPKYQAMKLSAQIAEEKQKEFDSQIALVQDVSRLKSQHKEAKEEFERVARLIPAHNERSAANLFVELEGLTAQNGILLDAISFGQSKGLGKEKEKKYFVIDAKLSLKGDYRSLKNFMRAIETNEHMMDITLISVIAVAEAKEKEAVLAQQTLSLTVNIDAYYQ